MNSVDDVSIEPAIQTSQILLSYAKETERKILEHNSMCNKYNFELDSQLFIDKSEYLVYCSACLHFNVVPLVPGRWTI